MVSNTLKTLEAKKRELTELEANFHRELAELPARYGFPNMKAFIAVLQTIGSRRIRSQKTTSSAPAGAVGRKKRAVITDETKAEVKRLIEEGKTGQEVADALGISLPSVQNIKKDLGLIGKARPKPAGTKPTAEKTSPVSPERRKRAVITDETKARVKELVEKEKTGLEIATILGISQPSVQNIKRELGLVKTRQAAP